MISLTRTEKKISMLDIACRAVRLGHNSPYRSRSRLTDRIQNCVYCKELYRDAFVDRTAQSGAIFSFKYTCAMALNYRTPQTCTRFCGNRFQIFFSVFTISKVTITSNSDFLNFIFIAGANIIFIFMISSSSILYVLRGYDHDVNQQCRTQYINLLFLEGLL